MQHALSKAGASRKDTLLLMAVVCISLLAVAGFVSHLVMTRTQEADVVAEYLSVMAQVGADVRSVNQRSAEQKPIAIADSAFEPIPEPIVAVAAPPPPIEPEPQPEAEEVRIEVTGIFMHPRNPQARINGLVASVGEQVVGRKVVRIEKDRVTLADPEGTVRIIYLYEDKP